MRFFSIVCICIICILVPVNEGNPTQLQDTSLSESDVGSSDPSENELISPLVVLAKYNRMKTLSKISTLAVKLAKESFFGKVVMKQCTVKGTQEHSCLPAKCVSYLYATRV